MGFAEQFKNESLKNTISNLKDKFKQTEVKEMSQNEILETLEKEKSQEKDEKIRGNYDLIIKAVKEWFAKKFNAEKARQTIIKKSQDEQLAKKAMEFLSDHPELEQFAKQKEVLGKEFVESVKKINAYTKKQSAGMQRSLTN